MTSGGTAAEKYRQATPAEARSPRLRREKRVLPGQRLAVRTARDLTRAFLAAGGVAPCGGVADTLTLAISELVTNAVVHATGPVESVLVHQPGVLQAAVTDHDLTRLPVRRTLPDTETDLVLPPEEAGEGG